MGLLSQDITIMATVAMDMEVMVIMATTARERLSQLPLLKLMLSQDIIIMVTLMVMVMDMATMDTMARGRPMLSPGIITMDMVDMDTMVTMAREKLSQDIIIMVTVMVDMAIMVMDTTVNKQHLFISFQSSVTYIGTCWNLVKRNTHLENKYKKSFS